MSYFEKKELKCFDIRYRATDEEANRVFLKLIDQPEYREFDRVDNLLLYGRFEAVSEAGSKLCEKHAIMRAGLARIVHKIIVEEGLE